MSGALASDTLRAVEAFVYREARLADEHRYDDWEALWADEATYWVPANGDDTDPTKTMSIIFDNRSRIRTRIKQLNTGKRHSQTPPSRLRRIVANVELTGETDCELEVGANVFIYESRERGVTIWASRTEWTLARSGGDFLIARKKVMLVNNDRALDTMAFLI